MLDYLRQEENSGRKTRVDGGEMQKMNGWSTTQGIGGGGVFRLFRQNSRTSMTVTATASAPS